MQNMETMLAELFGFQQFEEDEGLQQLIDDTMDKFDNSVLSTDDLAAAAGGNHAAPSDAEGSDIR